MELGFGHFAGKQNKSVKTGIKNKTGPKKKRDDRTHLTCGRNLQLSKVVEPMLLEVVKPIKKMLDTHKAALPFITKHHETKLSKAVHDAMKFPQGEESLPCTQVALCWAGMPEKPTKTQKQLAEEGGSGLHVDKMDSDDCNVVMCSCVNGVPAGFDFVSFLSPEGGVCFRVKTMHPQHVCLVFSKTHNLHGSVFPDKKTKIKEGVHGLRINCCGMKMTEKLIRKCSNKNTLSEVLRACEKLSKSKIYKTVLESIKEELKKTKHEIYG